MNIVIINKSDSTGGAAVVSRRLMEALRRAGVDARMLVAEKHLDSPFVELAASRSLLRKSFLAERLKIFMANGMDRETLFKIDTASDGVPLWRNCYVREADIICLNWVNQGLLSLDGLQQILRLGKPVVWTMHDMWNFTGICHHAGQCTRFRDHCGLCPLLGQKAAPDDLSARTWKNKSKVYAEARPGIAFVAVSNWLASRARESSLLRDADLSIIPNAFPFPESHPSPRHPDGKFRIAFGAARLDDPVKGLPILVKATQVLADRFPDIAARSELVAFGSVKDPDALSGFGIPFRHLGQLHGHDAVRKVYEDCDAVVSSSLYETLPGTLVEGQAYGCIPVSFDRGGQSDIVSHLSTGYIARWDDNPDIAAANLAEGLAWAAGCDPKEIVPRMDRSAREAFAEDIVANRYISLFERLLADRKDPREL